jgi:hypothetical protein
VTIFKAKKKQKEEIKMTCFICGKPTDKPGNEDKKRKLKERIQEGVIKICLKK